MICYRLIIVRLSRTEVTVLVDLGCSVLAVFSLHEARFLRSLAAFGANVAEQFAKHFAKQSCVECNHWRQRIYKTDDNVKPNI